MHRSARVLLALAALIAPTALSAQIAPDPTLAFASGTNPSGPWHFGWKTTALGSLTNLTVYSSTTGSARWSDGSIFGGVYYSGDLNAGGGTVTLHPFAGAQLAALRFVAPTVGQYAFVGSFVDGDSPTADYYMTLNNSSVLTSGYMTNNAPPAYFSYLLNLTTGDFIDFSVGAGGNGYGYDSVHLVLNPQGQVTVTPEPASLMMVATGLTGMLAIRRRRRPHQPSRMDRTA